MENNSAVSVLNDLIATSLDGEGGFQACAVDIDDPQLHSYFLQRAQACHQAAKQLQDLVLLYGGTPAQRSTLVGALHRRWVDIKAAITGQDNYSILAECERGEDIAVRHYREALAAADLPPEARALIERQYLAVQKNHDDVRQLRDKQRAHH